MYLCTRFQYSTMMIERKLKEVIGGRLFTGKAIILIGARQVGKTTLLKELTGEMKNVLWLNGDEMETRNLLQEVSVEKFRSLIGSRRVMVVDEAQRIENIGLKMKLITDQLPEVQLILTGSSSLDLANRINEPLTGRKWEYTMFPLSFGEMAVHTSIFEELKHLPIRLVYGYYPDVVTHPGDEREILQQITESYLYKDILEWEHIRKSMMEQPEHALGLIDTAEMRGLANVNLADWMRAQVYYNAPAIEDMPTSSGPTPIPSWPTVSRWRATRRVRAVPPRPSSRRRPPGSLSTRRIC